MFSQQILKKIYIVYHLIYKCNTRCQNYFYYVDQILIVPLKAYIYFRSPSQIMRLDNYGHYIRPTTDSPDIRYGIQNKYRIHSSPLLEIYGLSYRIRYDARRQHP